MSVFNWAPDVRTLFYGQFISFLITGTGIFASMLSQSRQPANNPMFLATLNYALLALYFNAKRARSGALTQPLSTAWYWYMFVALLDVEANVLVTSAYRYTSITSVMLLDCFSIPCTMLLSHCALGVRYSAWHVAGVLVCVCGLGLTVYSDVLEMRMRGGGDGDSNDPPHPLYGDVLCIIGAVLYSCSNVFQEVMVKSRQRTEYLGLIGGFGSVIGAAQTLLWEREALSELHWSPPIALYCAGFVGCLFLMYCNASEFLKVGDAPLFNLSLLTSDVYAVLFAYLAYGRQVHWLYYVAFAVTAVGICLYNFAAPLPTADLVTFHPGGDNAAGSANASGSGTTASGHALIGKETMPLTTNAMHYNIINPNGGGGRLGFGRANGANGAAGHARQSQQPAPRQESVDDSRYTFISDISVGESLGDLEYEEDDDYEEGGEAGAGLGHQYSKV